MNEEDNFIDIKTKERMDFLFNNDLEKMQKEFIDKKEKSCVKIIKNEKKDNNNNETNNIIYNNMYMNKNNKISKLKGKKKIKDVITLDIPIMPRNNYINEKNINKQSLFDKNFNNLKKTEIKNLDKNTGLPQTFKLNNLEEMNNNLNKIEKDKKDENNDLKKEDDMKNIPYKNEEYEKINIENIKKIQNMTKEEIDENTKEIFEKIPTSLIEKMKKGLITKLLKKENKNTENKNQEFLNSHNNNINNNKINEDNKNNYSNKTKKISNNNINQNKEEILYSYNGKTIKVTKNIQNNNNINKNNNIDFTHLTFNELELDNKYFSLLEIYNLLSSSNPFQIILGLKILNNLINLKLYLKDDDFSSKLYSFINALYYLIDNKNINIKILSLNIFETLLKNFFEDDYKQFKFNCYLLGNFPSFIIINYDNLSKNLKKCKINLINLINNFDKNLIQSIFSSNNKEIKNFYINILFFILYINGKIKNLNYYLDNEEFLNEIKNNQKIFKLFLILSNKDDLNLNKEKLEKYIKNKFLFNFILKIRGINFTSQIDNKMELKNINQKIYKLNYLLLFNDNIENNISDQIYLKENNIILLSKILYSKINYCTNTNNNLESDDFLPLFTNDSQIKFFESYYNKIINEIKDNNNKLDYFSKLCNYYYLKTFFYAYYKFNKYPKLINYKKFYINLNDILNLFPIINKELDNILFLLNNLIDKKERILFLYKYEIFLELCLNYVKIFIKNYELNLKNFSIFLIKLSELINKGDEYYYNKYIKIIKNILSRKFNNLNSIFNNKIKIDYNSIDIDLNFYLDSNENLRKSIFYKKYYIFNNNFEYLIDLINFIPYNSNDLIIDSKYFPFENNFIFQIIFNKNAKLDIKLNYFKILMILYYSENDYEYFKTITNFEIMIKFILNLRLVDFYDNKELYNTFECFVINFILLNDLNNINILDTDSNKVLLHNFFDIFEELIDYNKLYILLKITPILILFIHSKNIKNKNNKLKYIISDKYSKNIENFIYENIFYLLDIKNDFFITDEIKNNIIDYLIKNISFNNSLFYENIILSYLRINNNYENKKNTFIEIYILQLLNYFSINIDESFIKKIFKDKKILTNIIEAKFNK